MDGELEKREADEIIATLKKDEDIQENWETYHVIGDALRQSEKLSIDISHRVNVQLSSEPTILAPTIKPSQSIRFAKQKIFAVSIAASIVAMVTAWFGFQYQLEPQQMIIAERPSIESNRPMQPVMVSTPPPSIVYHHPAAEINDYLFVHREFLPGTVTNGQTVFVRPAVESHKTYGSYQDIRHP